MDFVVSSTVFAYLRVYFNACLWQIHNNTRGLDALQKNQVYQLHRLVCIPSHFLSPSISSAPFNSNHFFHLVLVFCAMQRYANVICLLSVKPFECIINKMDVEKAVKRVERRNLYIAEQSQ